jgi:hypothetical protein
MVDKHAFISHVPDSPIILPLKVTESLLSYYKIEQRNTELNKCKKLDINYRRGRAWCVMLKVRNAALGGHTQVTLKGPTRLHKICT